jgi:hypothetical protein
MQRRISALWWLRYDDHGDGSCSIRALWREDSSEPIAEEYFSLVEEPGRLVVAVRLGKDEGVVGPKVVERVLAVRNSRNVFAYGPESSEEG